MEIKTIYLFIYEVTINHILFSLDRVNLYELIKKNNFQGFSLALIRRFAHALLRCLQMLHREKIIHCDLKPVLTFILSEINIFETSMYMCTQFTI